VLSSVYKEGINAVFATSILAILANLFYFAKVYLTAACVYLAAYISFTTVPIQSITKHTYYRSGYFLTGNYGNV